MLIASALLSLLAFADARADSSVHRRAFLLFQLPPARACSAELEGPAKPYLDLCSGARSEVEYVLAAAIVGAIGGRWPRDNRFHIDGRAARAWMDRKSARCLVGWGAGGICGPPTLSYASLIDSCGQVVWMADSIGFGEARISDSGLCALTERSAITRDPMLSFLNLQGGLAGEWRVHSEEIPPAGHTAFLQFEFWPGRDELLVLSHAPGRFPRAVHDEPLQTVRCGGPNGQLWVRTLEDSLGQRIEFSPDRAYAVVRGAREDWSPSMLPPGERRAKYTHSIDVFDLRGQLKAHLRRQSPWNVVRLVFDSERSALFVGMEKLFVLDLTNGLSQETVDLTRLRELTSSPSPAVSDAASSLVTFWESRRIEDIDR